MSTPIHVLDLPRLPPRDCSGCTPVLLNLTQLFRAKFPRPWPRDGRGDRPVRDSGPAQRWRRMNASAPYTIALLSLGVLALAPLPFAIIGAACLAGAIAVRPSVAVPLVVLTLPFYLHPRRVGTFEISITELTILLGAAGVLGRWLVDRANGQERTGDLRVVPPHPSFVDWAAAGFLVAALLSLLVTEYPRQSIRELRWLIVEPIIVLYLTRTTVRSATHVREILWCLVAAGGAAAVMGVASLVVEGTLASPLARAANPYLSPNHLGLFLGRTGAVALGISRIQSICAVVERSACYRTEG